MGGFLVRPVIASLSLTQESGQAFAQVGTPALVQSM